MIYGFEQNEMPAIAGIIEIYYSYFSDLVGLDLAALMVK